MSLSGLSWIEGEREEKLCFFTLSLCILYRIELLRLNEEILDRD